LKTASFSLWGPACSDGMARELAPIPRSPNRTRYEERTRGRKRNRSRTTFDEAALLYDDARAGYPEVLFDDVVPLPGIAPGSRILAIGCGTGQATAPFARQS
jgi:2-polyprenyl-3-methyl-5-hydroxy-6-metoxy-1,4-benzoquinol methylase